jgi:hypothetical protein
VRLFAAQGCDHYNRKSLLPVLEAAYHRERNAKIAEQMQQHIAMLRDGYTVNPGHGQHTWLWVKVKNTVVGHLLGQRKMDSQRLRRLAQRIRRDETTKN